MIPTTSDQQCMCKGCLDLFDCEDVNECRHCGDEYCDDCVDCESPYCSLDFICPECLEDEEDDEEDDEDDYRETARLEQAREAAYINGMRR